MKKIVGILRPFDLKQTFYVYENGNKIDMANPTIDEITNTIFSLCEQHEITQVDLTGPKQYSKGIQEKIQQAELTKYRTSKITINII